MCHITVQENAEKSSLSPPQGWEKVLMFLFPKGWYMHLTLKGLYLLLQCPLQNLLSALDTTNFSDLFILSLRGESELSLLEENYFIVFMQLSVFTAQRYFK